MLEKEFRKGMLNRVEKINEFMDDSVHCSKPMSTELRNLVNAVNSLKACIEKVSQDDLMHYPPLETE